MVILKKMMKNQNWEKKMLKPAIWVDKNGFGFGLVKQDILEEMKLWEK